MSHTVIGVFPDRASANNTLDRLQELGYDPKKISIIMRDPSTGETVGQTTDASGNRIATGAASGAATGGIIGALAGLLVGVGAITIPGIGAFLIGGPIAAALGLTGAAATAASATVTGILAGGLVGALSNLGVPEDEAKLYERQINEGGILLAVPVEADGRTEVVDIMKNNGVGQVSTVNSP